MSATGIAWDLPFAKGISPELDALRESFKTGIFNYELDRKWPWYYPLIWSINSRSLIFLNWGAIKVTDSNIRCYCSINTKYVSYMKGCMAELYQEMKDVLPFVPMNLIFRAIGEEEVLEGTVAYVHASGELRFTEGMLLCMKEHPKYYDLIDMENRLKWKIGEIVREEEPVKKSLFVWGNR